MPSLTYLFAKWARAKGDNRRQESSGREDALGARFCPPLTYSRVRPFGNRTSLVVYDRPSAHRPPIIRRSSADRPPASTTAGSGSLREQTLQRGTTGGGETSQVGCNVPVSSG